MKIKFIESIVYLVTFLCLQTSFAAEKEIASHHISSELDLIKETRVETKYFSVMVPKGWSYKRVEWDKPNPTQQARYVISQRHLALLMIG